MSSHVVAMLVMSLATGAIFSFSMRQTAQERVRFALRVAGLMLGLALLVGWLMRPFPS